MAILLEPRNRRAFMAARSIASLSLTFGLVSIPIKLYSATESTSAIRFKLMGASGARVRQQYVTDGPAPAEAEPMADEPDEAPAPAPRTAASRVVDFPASKRVLAPAPEPEPPIAAPAVVERSQMVKGYEFEKGKFVLFSADELKALEAGSRQTIDIVAFVPEHAVDPVFYDKAYFLAPDKRGAKPYGLLLRAMRDTGRSALAKWAFRSKEYVVQIRAAEGGMVLQQLLYAEEVRSLADLDIEQVAVGDAELKLAKQLIEQISVDTYDPAQFVDEEKQRILAAVDEKIAGREIVSPGNVAAASGAQVVDLVAALRASLRQTPPAPVANGPSKTLRPALGQRKPVKRATRVREESATKGRAGKR
jgi:DNA end-binding protein Ku